MPELPEVETIRQDLRHKILNKPIVQVEVRTSRSVGDMNKQFIHALTSNTISEIDRRGKLMIFRLAKGDQAVLVHLKMTGQLIYVKEASTDDSDYPTPRPSPNHRRQAGSRLGRGRGGRNRSLPMLGGGRRRGYKESVMGEKALTQVEVIAGGHKLSESDIENLPNKHTRIVIVFKDGGQLFFNDMRMFGYMKLASRSLVESVLKKFGPEPFAKNFTFPYFSSLFKKRKNTNVKALLLNQELVAGLGNIYVDEVCWCAGVKPTRRVGSIAAAEQKKLFVCIPKILTEALKHRGTTFRNFLDTSGHKGNYTDFLKVYDRDGEPCHRCVSIIKKTTAAGRGTHYCPKCQK